MKVVLGSTNISKIQTKVKDMTSRGPQASTFLSCFLHCFVLVKNSVIICTWLFQDTKLQSYHETKGFNNKKSTQLWQKSTNIAVSKASLKKGQQLSFVE